MAFIEYYQEYIEFVNMNSSQILKQVVKTPNDAKNTRQNRIAPWKNHDMEGTISLSDRLDVNVTWCEKDRLNTRFCYTLCPCGYETKYDPQETQLSFKKDKTKGIPNAHIIRCFSVAEKVNAIDTDKKIMSVLIAYHKSMKRPDYKILHVYGEYGKITPIRRTSKKDLFSQNEISLIEKNDLDDNFLMSSVTVSSPSQFPRLPGVYFIRYFNDGKWCPLYIGKSVNLKERWTGHHRLNEIKFLQKLDIAIEFRYIAETPMLKFTEPLEVIESKLIKRFKPKLNRQELTHVSTRETAQSS